MLMFVHVSFQTNESGQDGFGGYGLGPPCDCVARKNGSPTGEANQAGKSPQHKTHHHRIFAGLRVIVGAVRNGPKTALLIQGLRSVIGAPDL